MDTTSLKQVPGYIYNEYLLVLRPHEDLSNRIMFIKNQFAEKYKSNKPIASHPHVAMVNFIQFEMMEERLINRLRTIAISLYPINIELKDFGSFPSHTIFIRVDSQLQVRNLNKKLKEGQQIMNLNKEYKAHFMEMPYVPVATKLLHWQYDSAWKEYYSLSFSGRFVVDSILLMKRKIGEKRFQIVQGFAFLNLPLASKQGELFI